MNTCTEYIYLAKSYRNINIYIFLTVYMTVGRKAVYCLYVLYIHMHSFRNR